MILSTFVGFSLAAAVSAAPALMTRELNSTKWTPNHILQPHEVILDGENGRSKSFLPVLISLSSSLPSFKIVSVSRALRHEISDFKGANAKSQWRLFMKMSTIA